MKGDMVILGYPFIYEFSNDEFMHDAVGIWLVGV